MTKIIIENRTDKPDSHIVRLVASVIENGRVSNNGKQYCYVTAFSNGVSIASELNKKSDRFIAYNEKQD